MALRDFFLGTGPKTRQLPRFTPEQQQAFSTILQQALSQLQSPQAAFEPIAQQARTQFEQRTIPSIAERFTAMGGQRSSAFGQQLGQAGAGLEESLASLGAQFGQRQQQLGVGLAGLGLQPQFETLITPGQPGFLQQSLKAALPLLLTGLSGGLGAPFMGASAGLSALSGLGG